MGDQFFVFYNDIFRYTFSIIMQYRHNICNAYSISCRFVWWKNTLVNPCNENAIWYEIWYFIYDILFVVVWLKSKHRLPADQAQEFFLNYMKRGPQAFQILIESLEKSGHISEANILKSPRQFNYNHASIHSTSSGEVSSTTGRNENANTTNGQFLYSSNSNSPTSSTSVPSSPLMRTNISR